MAEKQSAREAAIDAVFGAFRLAGAALGGVLYSKPAAQGASEVANALFGGTPYFPLGPNQVPADITPPDASPIQGVAVADPAEPQPAAVPDIKSPLDDPLHRALQQVRESSRTAEKSRAIEIG